MSDSPAPEQRNPEDRNPERLSPLHQIHVDGGASFTDFAGWQMPVSYGSDLAEHHAVRTAAGIFDISHMAEIGVTGPQATDFLDFALAGKMSTLALMQAKYSLLLDEHAGIIDDLIVYHNADGHYLVVANAGNHDVVVTELTARTAGFDVTVTDQSDATALIAVQGPRALEILQATKGLAVMDGQQPFADLKYYWSTVAAFNDGAAFGDSAVFVGRTGYTGEDGFELYVDTADAQRLWQALLTAGGPLGLIPAGLASRDTLRLEAGMPLYGHELGRDILPVQAGLGRVVHYTKEGDFVGRAAAEAGPEEGSRVLVGLVSEGRRAGRAGYGVYLPLPERAAHSGEGHFWPSRAASADRRLDGRAGRLEGGTDEAQVGAVTSGALSPTLGYPIAMAFVDPQFSEPGTVLELDVRGSRIPATVTALPFYTREKN